jgi:hypothetical protein
MGQPPDENSMVRVTMWIRQLARSAQRARWSTLGQADAGRFGSPDRLANRMDASRPHPGGGTGPVVTGPLGPRCSRR